MEQLAKMKEEELHASRFGWEKKVSELLNEVSISCRILLTTMTGGVSTYRSYILNYHFTSVNVFVMHLDINFEVKIAVTADDDIGRIG